MHVDTVDGLLRISDPQADVVLNYDSGDRRMFSPNGSWLLFESQSQRYVIDLSDRRITKVGFDVQFNHESALVGVQFEGAGYGEQDEKLGPVWQGWFPGDQDGDRFLHATHRAYYSKDNQPWTLCLFDGVTHEVIEQFTFEHAMPGATWAGRPHDLRYIWEEETWVCQLSAYANPGWHRNAIYAFDRDGSSARKLAGSEKWSHPTFSGKQVAYGQDNGFWMGDWSERQHKHYQLRESYGHGTLIGDRLVLSNAKRFINEDGVHRARDTQVIIATERSQEVIRNLYPPTDLYAHRARPTISRDGTKAAWNEVHEGRSSVMVWGVTPKESEVDRLRKTVSDLRSVLDRINTLSEV